MSDLISRAARFARVAHVGQKRKYTGEPYVTHCEHVANLVRYYGGDDEMIAAAWLHDVVEDTDATFVEIAMQFGLRVASLVSWLTDISKPSDGNREARKAIDREHTACAPWDAQFVKLCDLMDNALDIAEHDPTFATVFLAEKERLLEVMDAKHPRLRLLIGCAYETLRAGQHRLVQHNLEAKK